MKSSKKKIGKIIGIFLLSVAILAVLVVIAVRVIFHSYYDKLIYDDGKGGLDVETMTTEYVLANDPDVDPTATESDAETILTMEEQLKRNLEDKNNCVEFFHLIESYIFVFKIILFICLIWLCWVFVAIRAFL